MRMLTDQLREERRDSNYSDTFYYDPVRHGSVKPLKRAPTGLKVLHSTDKDRGAKAIELEDLS